MTLPPLPDIFGNYAIRGIVEVSAPQPVSWWPATTGWKVLLLLTLLLLARSGWHYWRRWQRNRYRGAALSELQCCQDESLPAARRLTRIATLLKATALQTCPRRDVASLSGHDWLEWLDSSTDTQIFSAPSRALLQDALYQRGGLLQAPDITRLAAESADWIRRHRGPLDA